MTRASAFALAAELLTPSPRKYAAPGDVARVCDATVRQSPVLDLLDAELVSTMDDPDTPNRLMFFMPPQEGKSQRVSRWLPVWLLEHDPTLRIGIVSYELESAVRWGRAIKRDLEANPDLGVRLMQDSRAAGRWETTAGGGVVCVGIRGALTGKPLDVLIIDDPVKDRASAESRILRDAAWEFWEQVAELRLSARGRVVLIMTRWHEDDLAGRILKAAPAEWRVVSVPAISEGADDPLGREEGEELTSVQRRAPGHFTRMRAKMARYAWLALFQQRPSALEGNLFKRADWRYWRPAESPAGHAVGEAVRLGDDDHLRDLRDAYRFITCDLAASKRTSADYTVASAWGILPNGEVLLLDRVRDRVEDSGHWDLIEPLRQRWLGPYDTTYVETAMFGTTFVYAAGRAGVPLEPLKADTDKVTRALAAAPLVRQHRVYLPAEAPWLDEWLAEHAEFPTGTHDDQVDTTGYMARVALAHWLPPETTPRPPGSARYEDDALGRSNIDLMRAEF